MSKIRALLKKIYMYVGGLRPLKKKIVFTSFGGRQYSQDPRAISEKMHKMYPEYELVWIISPDYRQKLVLPEYVRCVDAHKGMTSELTNAIAFVTTNPIEPVIVKRKSQFFVQTWHGDRGFKKCLYESWPDGKRPVEILDGKLTNLAVAASDYGEDVYHKAFHYYGEISKVGMPRNDKLVNPTQKEILDIKLRLDLPLNYKILTYAPTFRDDQVGKQNVAIDIMSTLKELNKKDDMWICLIRSHAASKGLAVECNNLNVFDVSDVSDMADILMITDMLITDYSSCAGDFIVTGKPVILAHFDREEYENSSRELRVDINKTGFLIAHNQDELNTIISAKSDSDYKRANEQVMEYYNTIETGCASEFVCRRIHEAYCNRKKRI